MYDSTTMMGMYRVNSATKGDIRFRQRMQYREIDIQFQVVIRDSRPQILGGPHMRDPKIGKHDRTEMVLFRIPFAQVQVIHKVDTTDNKIILVISMETPPSFFRKINEEDTHDASAKSWTEKDTWFRQTDIVYNPSYLKRSSLTLKKTKPIIDIGKFVYFTATGCLLILDQVAGLPIASSLTYQKMTISNTVKFVELYEITTLKLFLFRISSLSQIASPQFGSTLMSPSLIRNLTMCWRS